MRRHPAWPATRTWRAGLLAGLPFLFVLLLACSSDREPGRSDGRLLVSVSTGIIADLALNVAGDAAEVWAVVPDVADPHSYSARPSQIARLTESDLVITVGANLEDFATSAAWRRNLRETGIPHVELATLIEDVIVEDRVIDHGDHVHDLRDGDPHIWLDPLIVIDIVEIIRRELTRHDPANAEVYAANATRYTRELELLHEELFATLSAVPPERRRLLVSHDAYSYFARRYGFEVTGYVTRADNAEPSAREVAELVQLIESSGVPAVFKEEATSARILEQLAAQTEVRVGTLMADSLSPEATNYLDMMRFNAASIARYLGGPED